MNCGMYRGVILQERAMKIVEQVLEKREQRTIVAIDDM